MTHKPATALPETSYDSMSPQTAQYIRMIRNSRKREYAIRFWNYLEREAKGESPEPPRFSSIGYMAAQAVRINLIELRRHYG